MDDVSDTCSQREIDVFARKLIGELGIRATDHAAVTIALMKDRGDIEGMRLWRRIHGAVSRLRLLAPDAPGIPDNGMRVHTPSPGSGHPMTGN